MKRISNRLTQNFSRKLSIELHATYLLVWTVRTRKISLCTQFIEFYNSENDGKVNTAQVVLGLIYPVQI